MEPGLKGAAEIIKNIQETANLELAANGLLSALAPRRVSGLGIRIYRDRMHNRGDDVGKSLFQVLPTNWESNLSARYIEQLNPLPMALRRLDRLVFRWSDASPKSDPAWKDYWEAWRELGVFDGLAVHMPAPNGTIKRFSIGLSTENLQPRELDALILSAAALLQKVDTVSGSGDPRYTALSPRETDCMALVVEGMSDGEISACLKISVTTVHTHIESAKRKLKSRTRAQAASRFVQAAS